MVQGKIPQEVPQSSGLLHFAIWLLIFVVLLAVVNHFLTRVFDNAATAEARTAVQSYAQSIIGIHKQWILQGKPQRVRMKGLDMQGNPGNDWIILMNRSGWPINVIDGDNDKPDCKALWYALQKTDHLAFSGRAVKMTKNAEGELLELPFNPDLEQARKQGFWVCQNTLAQNLQFSYRLDTGKVVLEGF